MKKINKIQIHLLKSILKCSEAEVMKNLEEFKCKRNYTDLYQNLQKNKFYYATTVYQNMYAVISNDSLVFFSIINCDSNYYFFDYFMTETEMRNEKLIKLQQISNHIRID